MSPLPNSAAAPAPQRAALQPVPSGAPSGSRWLFIVLALLLLAGAAWWLRPRPRKPAAGASVPTVRVIRGALLRTVRLSGSISAKNYVSIAGPLLRAPDNGRGLVLIYVPPFGSMVRKGDVIAKIDGQAMKDHLDDVIATVDQSAMDLKKLRSQQMAIRQALEQSVYRARAAWEKARLDLQTGAVRSAIQREQFKLSEEQARAVYDEVHGELNLLADRQAAEWQFAQLNQQNQIHHRDRHQADLDRCVIKSPIDGQVVMRTTIRNGQTGQVQLGDELAPGQPFMRVVDPSTMQLDATLNQADADQVHLGQKATVHFDAYPNLVVSGKIEAVGTLAIGGRRINYWVRQVPVRIALDGRDTRVIPDLTASADVVLAEQDEALLIPREAVQETDGKAIVYVKQGENVVPREVELGPATNTQVSVTAGLQAGDEVAIKTEPRP
jgi:RND family efflux transporter MFP subunit